MKFKKSSTLAMEMFQTISAINSIYTREVGLLITIEYWTEDWAKSDWFYQNIV